MSIQNQGSKSRKPIKRNSKKRVFKKDDRVSSSAADEDDYSEKIVGQVVDALPNTHFRIKTIKGDIIAYMGGKMRVHKIRILVGDRVEILLDEYGGKARLIKRL